MTTSQAEGGPSSSKFEPTLNEEGLPFVDLNEPVERQNDAEGKGKGVVLPFVPSTASKADRKAWLEARLKDIEAEDAGRGAASIASQSNSASQSSAIKHTRVASADRPAPIRSVLKHSSSGTSTPQRFGASGMRKGFLNMNPSSPAAEHSSDPIDKFLWGVDEPMSASTSSLGSAGDYIKSNGSGTDDGRSSRDASSKVKIRKKKTVRIQSPERRRESVPSIRDQLEEPVRQARKVRDKADESTEDAAKMIVDLLGVEAIKGHPQYETIKANIEREQRSAVVADVATASTSRDTKLPVEPAVRRDVVERDNTSAKPVQNKSGGVWRRGFLREMPSSSSIPIHPQQSQGISALERASRKDDSELAKKSKSDVKTTLPHARPSKAFAAKLQAKRKGTPVDAKSAASDDEGGMETGKTSRVRFGEDEEGKIAVSVGVAATESSGEGSAKAVARGQHQTSTAMEVDEESSGDERMVALGLDVHDEVLDDEQAEALGYFSNEDVDPDIGFDSDDLIDAYPQFDSEATDIADVNLRQEYERVKAHLQRKNGLDADMLRESSAQYSDDEHEQNDSRASRFKREKLHRLLMNKPATSKELGSRSDTAGLRNAGPSMVIPSLVDIRYPKPMSDGSTPTRANQIELDGQSDEDDDRLEDEMRVRLNDLNLSDGHPLDQRGQVANPVDVHERPPEIVSASPRQAQNNPDSKKRKTSLFKARMQQG